MYGYPVGTEEVLADLVVNRKNEATVHQLAKDCSRRNHETSLIIHDLIETGFVRRHTHKLFKPAYIKATRKGCELVRMLERTEPSILSFQGYSKPNTLKENKNNA